MLALDILHWVPSTDLEALAWAEQELAAAHAVKRQAHVQPSLGLEVPLHAQAALTPVLVEMPAFWSS